MICSMAKLLMAEDDLEFAQSVSEWLKTQHHTVDIVTNGVEALEWLSRFQFDVVILDWNMPLLSGPEVCTKYRATGGTTPILMLTGEGGIDQKESGFDAGADDYLTKPADLRELSSRVKALLRRSAHYAGNTYSARNIVLDTNTHVVAKNGQQIALLPKEFALLEYLLRNKGRVFSMEHLIDAVWSSESDVTPATVKTCVSRLRTKIDDDNADSLIRTIYSVGYTIDSEDQS
jgi:two-component system, OmpR family, copper resistance phosphate regulon response regulator CusR